MSGIKYIFKGKWNRDFLIYVLYKADKIGYNIGAILSTLVLQYYIICYIGKNYITFLYIGKKYRKWDESSQIFWAILSEDYTKLVSFYLEKMTIVKKMSRIVTKSK